MQIRTYRHLAACAVALVWLFSSGALALCAADDADDAPNAAVPPAVIVVVGAEGEETFGSQFQQWAEQWQEAAESAGADFQSVGPHDASDDATDALTRLQRLIGQHSSVDENAPPLWIVLIGHGTFADETAKFNLTGPDLAATTLQEWLGEIKRPLVIVNCASASGPFLQALAAPDRVVVTATRNGTEQNFARFGEYMAAAINNFDADLDHDNAVSILEAFLMAAAQTKQFYDSEGRLATEHPLLDDNGDGIGTPPEFFSGTRVNKQSASDQPVDGALARYVVLVSQKELPLSDEQRRKRDDLEQQLEAVRAIKDTLPEAEYYEQLEEIFQQLAAIYNAAE